MSSVLFVCSGNLCRSPMAMGLFRQALVDLGTDRPYRVFSAGIWATDGQPASPNAVAAMAERGIDISDHAAHTIVAQDLAEADLVLVMGQEHVAVLAGSWPQYAWKVFRLSEMTGRRRDIQDPYGRPLEAYRECANTIAGYLQRGQKRILELA